MRGHFLPGPLVALLVIAGPAMASDDVMRIPANRTTSVGDFYAYSETCNLLGKPQMTVPGKPKHGTVKFEWVSKRLGDDAGACKGRTGRVMRAWYTPTKGYRGQDSFKIGIRFPKYEGSNETSYDTYGVTVDVR
jgi:hypothetical protein